MAKALYIWIGQPSSLGMTELSNILATNTVNVGNKALKQFGDMQPLLFYICLKNGIC